MANQTLTNTEECVILILLRREVTVKVWNSYI